MDEQKELWKDRKRWVCGLPWTFTEYSLTEDTLKVKTGFLVQKFEEIKLYKIRDFTVFKGPIQRLFKIGTIHICSADNTSPEFDSKNVRNAVEVKDLMSNQVDICKEKYGVTEEEQQTFEMGAKIAQEIDDDFSYGACFNKCKKGTN